MKIARLLVCAALALGASPVLAQAYPARPVTLIVPFPAGSATDLIARLVGAELREALGQPFVVENKPGAQGTIAAALVARSPADGHTLLVATNTHVAAVSLYKRLPYDPLKDFAPVARLATTSLVLMVKADAGARTLPEFIAHLRKNPGKLAAGYGSSSAQVCVSQLKKMAQVDITEVPYKGIPLAVNDLLGGAIDFTCVDLGNAMSQAKGGKLRALAITEAKRSPLAPDWPAMAELLPGYEVTAWFALLAPAATPADVVRKVEEAALKAMEKPAVREKLATLGMQAAPIHSAQLAPFLQAQLATWARLIKDAGIQPE